MTQKSFTVAQDRDGKSVEETCLSLLPLLRLLCVQVRDGQGIDPGRYPARSLTQTCLVAVLIACFVRRERLGRDQGDLAVKTTSWGMLPGRQRYNACEA